MPIAPTSTSDLLDLLQRSGVAAPDRLAALPNLGLPDDPQKAAAVLVAQGVVTRFQAQQLLAGRHKGFRLGPYAILDLLGRGGMGAVYLGEHRELRRKVAIKVLVPGKDDDQKLAVERFQREARAAAALDHPNIVRVFDVSRHGETPYLVMEYVEGETLQEILDRDGAIPYSTATEYVAQTAAGLQHAYEKGFVHRDIKPGNLIRDKSGTVKILDMGLARSESAKDKLTEQLDAGAVVGTADFIAPEQGLNQPVDVRADIYSLGATFFVLIIGKPPFEGNTTQKLLQHQLRSAPTLASLDATLPKGLSAVVAKMLAKKPEDRFQTPGDVIAALAPWMGNSSRILAGLSRTNLGQGAALQAALSDIALGGSSQRLGAVALGVMDSGEVDASLAAQETGAVAAAITTRDTPRPGAAGTEPPARGKKMLLYAGIGLAVLAAGAIAGFAALGGKKEPDASVEVRPQPQPQPQPAPTPNPNPNPTPNPNPNPNPPVVTPKINPPTGEPALFRLDLAGLRAFGVRSGLMVDPNDATKKVYRFIAQTGAGTPPAGWSARAWNAASEMEYFAEEGERPALGVRPASGPGSAMLFMPKFDCPSGVCRVRIEYSATTAAGKFTVRFKSSDNRAAWDVARPAPTGPTWRTEEFEADLRGAAGGFFEFHNGDDRPDAVVRLRALEVFEVKASRPEKVLFAVDAADLPTFKNAKTGRTKSGGDNDPSMKGVYFGGWKPETTSEWESGTFAGAKSLKFTNLNEVVSAQIGIDLEGATGVGAKVAPGQPVRLRVVYRTTGKGRGSIYFQNTDDRKVPDRATLANSNNQWATADVFTNRGNSPLRCLIDTGEPGAGNSLIVRSVTISEVGKPGPVPVATTTPAPNPNDPARWAEGPSVFKFDATGIAPFRVQKEKGMRLSGDAEKLPAGVGCQCWKEKAVGEFRCDVIDGTPALGLTNLNDEMSAQFTFALETALKAALVPGRAYRVKVTYQTKNDATGNTTVQVVPGYKGLASAKLTNTADGKWATAVASFVRPPAEDKVELRLAIDNTSVGEGNTVWVRSLEVVELLSPKK